METKKPPLFEGATSEIEKLPEEAAAKEKAFKEEEKRQVNWPMKNIKEPHENDVLSGRGGRTNHHPGNKRYRTMVEGRKLEYVNCKPQDKSLVALSIVRVWRAQQPPGRFLKEDKDTGLWTDVGDKNAWTKTSQALRESAPLIRKQQEDERLAAHRSEYDSDDEEGDDGNGKSTRFAGGTNTDADAVSKTMLVRDHTFGRESLNEGDFLTLDGFSWQSPFPCGSQNSDPWTREGRPGTSGYLNHHSGCQGPPVRFPSHASLEPPSSPPPEAHVDMANGDPLYASQGRYESWGHISPPMPGYAYPQQSRNWTSDQSSHKATCSDQDCSRAIDSRTNSWSPLPAGCSPPMDHHAAGGQQYPLGRPHTPPRSHRRPPPETTSPGHSHEYRPPRSSGPPARLYSIDLTVASAWSGQDPMEIAKTWSTSSSEDSDRFRSSHGTQRPEIIKHATSSQNETTVTTPGLRGPSVKRAALNRDNSMASNRLKEKYVPGFNKPFSLAREMRQLSANLRQTSLSRAKPKPMSEADKQSTFDLIFMDLMEKPLRSSDEACSSTIEALGLDLDDDPFLRLKRVKRRRTMEKVFKELRDGVPKAPSVSLLNRLTSTDVVDMVNEPIGRDEELFCLWSSAGDIGVPEFTEHPGKLDVLLRRGPRYYRHPGNVRFHKEKLLIQEQYKQASKVEKTKLSQSLVDKVHAWGGKFLKKDVESGRWIDASSQEARLKAAQVLRESFTPEERREKRLKYHSQKRKAS